MRTEALESYHALPLPETTEEHWRFTDLKDFDPDSFGHVPGTVPGTGPAGTMLELDVAGLATITESGIEIERAPEGITFAPLTEEHERLYSLVGWDEKFAAHNAAVWKHGLLVVVPKGVELEKPLYVRVTNSTEGGSLFWRLLVVAEEGARFTLVEEVILHRSGPALVHEHGAGVLPRAGLEVRVRLDPEPLAGDLALRHAPRAGRARRRARLGRRRLRLEEGQGPHPERPRRRRRDLARHRCVLHRR